MQLALRAEIPDDLYALPISLYLDVVDYVLSHEQGLRRSVVTDLEEMLSAGGSAWRATSRGLERRVDEAHKNVADSVFAIGGRSAQHLREAWHRAWGRNPDASGAYREAVRGVEAAFAPIVSPLNASATLGTVIADINNKPSKFSARLQADEPVANVERLAGMLQMLWKSQFDRHGTPDENVPLNVSIDEARDAVALATTLVHLAQQGGFSANGC